MASSYRADIDGLRAIAVLAVLLFHAGIPGIPGGYVGVDIFFVISGYLITSILRREAADGSYSVARFYERRIRRILPALIVVSIVTVLLSAYLLLPSVARNVPKEAVSALGFVANIYFWQTSDYFAPAAETKPFLHTWSLGVEEQFYILMPLIMLAIATRPGRLQLSMLIALAAVSFGLSAGLTGQHPEASFYLLPMRAWELLAGSLLSYVPIAAISSRRREALAVLGLALLAIAIFGFDKNTLFPGYLAAIPVSGAVLLIYAAPGTWIGAALSTRPMVGVGLISYSLYLWHWPLVVFANGGALSFGRFETELIVGLSLLLGFLSWRFVERPFRNPRTMPTRRLMRATAMGACAVLGVAGLFAATGGRLGGFGDREIAFDLSRGDYSPWRHKCHIATGVDRAGGYCNLGDGSKGKLTVWGDSHGVELSAALAQAGYEVQAITYSACPPALGYTSVHRPDCKAHNDSVFAQLNAAETPSRVILATYYNVYAPPTWPAIVATANKLANRGRDVVVIGPMPTPGLNVPTHLAFGRDPMFPAKTADIDKALADLDPRVTLIRPTDLFCKDGTCSMLVNGAPILFDDNHPSLKAARLIASRLPSAGVAAQQ